MLKGFRISPVYGNPPRKAAVVERAVRTVKLKLARLREGLSRANHAFPRLLAIALRQINETKNRSTGYPPNQVGYHNAKEVYERLYGGTHTSIGKFSRVIPAGTRVRVREYRGSAFSKESQGLNSRRLYAVSKVLLQRAGLRYKLYDIAAEFPISGTYSRNELTVVKE